MKFIAFDNTDGAIHGLPLSDVIRSHANDRVGGTASDVQMAEVAAEFEANPQAAIDWAVSHMDFETEIRPKLKLLKKPVPADVRSAWLASLKTVIDV